LRAVFVDADDALAAITEKLRREGDLPVAINRDRDVTPDELPALLGDAEIAIIDHTRLPTLIGAQCRGLKHVVFLGTGARSYMNPEELAARGITVHIHQGLWRHRSSRMRHRVDVGVGQRLRANGPRHAGRPMAGY
jgi:D-3-phosphoglycerate dehydrogenase